LELASGETEREKENPQPCESKAIEALTSALPSPESQKYYPLRLKPFFDLADVPGGSLGEKADHFTQKARENPQWAYDVLLNYVSQGKHRVNVKKDLAAGTLRTNFDTIKLFYECNDLGTITSSVPP
jgi:hypothetical protein